MKKDKIQASLVLLLGFVGIGIASYLTMKGIQGEEITNCPIFGSGCTDVLKSEYSTFLGIPLSVYGIIFYTGMSIVSALYLALNKKILLELLSLGALIGFIDSAIFLYIQGVLIGSFCFYCVMSALTATLMFFIMLPTLIYKLLDWFE